METKENETYYIATDRGTVYIAFDEERNEATMLGGDPVVMKRERLTDFLHTAELLGFMAGKI